MLEHAERYTRAGFSVIPVHHADDPDEGRRKRPTGSWKSYQTRIATDAERQRMFSNGAAIAVVCGPVSGNLEVIDFDDPDLFDPCLKAIRGHDAALAGKLVVHQITPSGGAHLLYRCNDPVTGNQKLAMTEDGKNVLIETRGQGGYFLIEPSRGYELHGDLEWLPVISKSERDLLLWIAKGFDRRPKESAQSEQITEPTGDRPGDIFNRRAEWSELLESDGWTIVGNIGDRVHWTRPGKKAGTSATLHPDMGLFIFSTSTNLPSERPLDKFGYLAWSRFNGDFGEAARYVRGLYPEEFRSVPVIPVSSGHSGQGPVTLRSDSGQCSGQERSLAEDVLTFIEMEPAPFTNSYLYSELCVTSRREKKTINDALYYYEKQGKIKKIDGKRGHWEVVEDEPAPMDLLSADIEPFNILLPLDISDYAIVRPKGIILCAGSNNAGKSGFLFWVCRNFFAGTHTHTDPNAFLINEKEKGVAPEILYLNSEMSKQELVARIKCFGDDPALWQQHVKFIERSHSFDKLVKPNGVNFVDFLEVPEDFFLAGKYIADIHKKLESGIALVAMQKKQNSDFAKGGEMTLEKPRLAINLDKNEPHGFTCKITKLKEPRDFKKNIQGMTRDFVITRDSQILPISDWRFVTAKDRDKINAEYNRNNLPTFVRSTGMSYLDMPDDFKVEL